MTNVTKIVVRDCDKQADTAIVFTNGCTLYENQLPAHWTLDFQASHTDKFFFNLDSGLQQCYEATPYCPLGHNTPLNLTVGNHEIKLQIGTEPIEVFTFTIAAAPPAAIVTAEFGTNGDGVQSTGGDLSLHPNLLAACAQFNFKFFRLWTTGAFNVAYPADYFKIPLEWAAKGIKVLAVLNFQNSVPRCSAPTDADWLQKVNEFPTASASGIWAICVGNEIDTSAYYSGTVQQYAHLLELAYPILKEKGYKVICGSTILSLNYLHALQALNAFQFCDYLDFHVYGHGITDSLGATDAAISYAASVGKPLLVSECGIRGVNTDMTSWTTNIIGFFEGLKTRNGIFLQFPLYWIGSGDGLCQMSPIGADSNSENAPFYAAWQSITK